MKLRNWFVGAVTGASLCMFAAQHASANTWDFDGVVEECNALACPLADIAIGDPFTGFLQADNAVSGPNSTFDETGIIDYSLVVQDVAIGAADSDIVSASVSTDGAGEISSGSVSFFGVFDAGLLGDVNITMTIDLTNSTWVAETDFLGLGEVASGSLTLALEPDGDDVPSTVDNCLADFNPDQRDTDADGYGNGCDADLDNDCTVNFSDLGIMKAAFFASGDLDTDLDGDMQTNFNDLSIMKAKFFGEPGPSALTNICDAP